MAQGRKFYWFHFVKKRPDLKTTKCLPHGKQPEGTASQSKYVGSERHQTSDDR